MKQQPFSIYYEKFRLGGLQENAGSGGLVVVMSRGLRIEVSRWFDASTLERLLAVLEQV